MTLPWSRGFIAVSVVTVVLLAVDVHPGKAVQRTASPPSPPSSTNNTTPPWLAWKVFHESLIFYSRQSMDQVADVVHLQAGLDRGKAAALLTAGRTFVAALDRIDADARNEVQRRYGVDKAPPRDRSATSRPILVRPGKTVYQMVVEDGLYAQVERDKHAALERHLAELSRLLGVDTVTELDRFVSTTVAPHVTTSTDRGQPVSAIDRSFSGNVMTPGPSR
jgi:hypothetical protein